MKKLLWILGTVIACVLVVIAIAFIVLLSNIGVSIITRSEIQTMDSRFFGLVMLFGCVAVIVASFCMWKRYAAKCLACKRWGAQKLIRTDILKQEDIHVLRETTQRNRYGEVTGTAEQYIPGKRNTLQDTYKCKYCGHLETYIRTEKRADI